MTRTYRLSIVERLILAEDALITAEIASVWVL